jgi:hypothetical protein
MQVRLAASADKRAFVMFLMRGTRRFTCARANRLAIRYRHGRSYEVVQLTGVY